MACTARTPAVNTEPRFEAEWHWCRLEGPGVTAATPHSAHVCHCGVTWPATDPVPAELDTEARHGDQASLESPSHGGG